MIDGGHIRKQPVTEEKEKGVLKFMIRIIFKHIPVISIAVLIRVMPEMTIHRKALLS